MVGYNELLVHYGVKGMHWGERRYQNKDGSLTSAGRSRYSGYYNGVVRRERAVANATRRLDKYDTSGLYFTDKGREKLVAKKQAAEKELASYKKAGRAQNNISASEFKEGMRQARLRASISDTVTSVAGLVASRMTIPSSVAVAAAINPVLGMGVAVLGDVLGATSASNIVRGVSGVAANVRPKSKTGKKAATMICDISSSSAARIGAGVVGTLIMDQAGLTGLRAGLSRPSIPKPVHGMAGAAKRSAFTYGVDNLIPPRVGLRGRSHQPVEETLASEGITFEWD